MIAFSTVTEAPAPVQILKEIWGPVAQGQEPWKRLRVKSRSLPGISLAYDRAKGETMSISLKEGRWALHIFKESPHTVEEALRRGTSRPHAWEVVYHGADVVEASRAFVRWCLS